MTVVLRFIFGALLALGIVFLVGLPLTFVVIFVVAVGSVAAIWGDKFLLGFMSMMKFLR